MATATAQSLGKVRTPAGDAPVLPMLMLGIGAYLAWFAIHYWRDQRTIWPSDPVKDVLQGKGLPAPDHAAPIATGVEGAGATGGGGGGGGGTGPGGTSSGKDIAADAMRYKGHCYLYGGAPGADGKRCWDCSSFVNWVIGHDMKLAIPGVAAGAYDGTSHGPATGSWISSTLLKTITKKQIQPGDIMVWQTHMGIAISNTEMISALNPRLGTEVTKIHQGAPPGEVLVPRRLHAVLGTGPGGTGPGPKGSYSHAGLMGLWRLAGGSKATANNAACHAIQESSGNPLATSRNPDGGTNVGLWQLDTKGKGAGHSIAALKNPLTNARITVKATRDGRDWSAWATPGC